MRLRTGILVEVYHDPITRLEREGSARIHSHVIDCGVVNGRELHRYLVKFVGDRKFVERNVLSLAGESLRRETGAR